VLRRDTPHGVEFVTLALFESIEAVRRFAGENEDVPVIEPRAAELLAQYDPRVRHFGRRPPRGCCHVRRER
jgi:hypothetical protein